MTGFISKKDAESFLLTKVPGTFLLRFSDSEIGGISVAYVGSEHGIKKVWHLQPWFSKDLLIRPLADRHYIFTFLFFTYSEVHIKKKKKKIQTWRSCTAHFFVS